LRAGASFAVAVGSSGGSGGISKDVNVTNSANITTTGQGSAPIRAETLGGGGGDAGVTVAAAIQVSAGNAITVPITVGGNGGQASSAGSVVVNNYGALSSQFDGQGPLMPGIEAQSVGGGGGNANWIGSLSLSVSGASAVDGSLATGATIGGKGGAGGNGGGATVNNFSSITTAADSAPGIFAQSIGGAGGNASDIVAATISASRYLAMNANFVMGQNGGSAGSGGAAIVNNSGKVTTYGAGSDAILAQSTGGGGGDAGGIYQLNLSAVPTKPGTKAATVNLTLGGSGGAGRQGGAVTVSSSGDLTTHGDSAKGIFAHSEGGGGGDGSVIYSIQDVIARNPQAFGFAATLQLGGSGGSGATGGTVRVTTAAGGTIVTTGGSSGGVVARSVGGGGGNARATFSLSPLTTTEISVKVGGTGGTGGNGGTVIVDNASALTLSGNNSAGIFAQSVGGGGGDSQATSVYAGTIANSGAKAGIGVSVGLGGAAGGVGGSVTVTNTNAIQTGGDSTDGARTTENNVPLYSYGIFAQSVGGGGGDGGSASFLFPKALGGQSGNSFNGKITVGGTGGTGGTGGNVNVTNSGAISTVETESHGIFAQSVGGGGGKGGMAVSNAAVLYGKGNSYSAAISVGGSGGTGNSGGVVTVTTAGAGSIETEGDAAHGIWAQSIGGGGGDGGSAFSLAGGFTGGSSSGNLTIGIGGTGGSSGSGGAVVVDSAENIVTMGDGSMGIYAQSIGGGGGDGGNASTATLSPLRTASLSVGGNSGATGAGGAVTVTDSSATVETNGGNSAGVYAQSVGGGGGRGGVGLFLDSPGPVLGGGGNVIGDGGEVTVTLNNGAQVITAGSSRAYGIWAQSIGGGGGEAGGVGFGIVGGIIDTPYFSTPGFGFVIPNKTFTGNPPSGNGGKVTVSLANAGITTHGTDAIGIFAQSVGGGGGLADQVPVGGKDIYQVGTTGYGGNGGDVTIQLSNGLVTTSGQYSHGVFAQSAGGSKSTGGTVQVTLNNGSAVLASGTDASGIFADDIGDGGQRNGKIDISIGEGSMVSGGVESSLASASGVRLLGGAANVITNAGVITTATGVDGVAIRADGSNLTVTNTGTIIGSILTSGGVATVDNLGVMTTGSQMVLGAGGQLLNQGALDIGGVGRIASTVLVGDLVQTSTGRLGVDQGSRRADGSVAADMLTVQGNAVLAGQVQVNSTIILPRVAFPFMTVTGSATGNLAGAPSPLFGYSVSRLGNLFFASNTSADLAPVSFDLQASRLAVAGSLQSAWVAGGDPIFDSLFALLNETAATGGASAYSAQLRQLSPDATLAPGARGAANAQDFANAALSCPQFEGTSAMLVEGQCDWMRVTDRMANLSNGNGVTDFRQGISTWQVGGQAEFAPGWLAGGSLAYENSFFSSADGLDTGNGQMGYGAVTVKRQTGPWLFAASAFGGFGRFDTRRTITLPGFASVATGKPDMTDAGLLLRAAYTVGREAFYLRPSLTLTTLCVSSGPYQENGWGSLNLAVDRHTQTTAVGTPMLEIGGRINLSDNVVLRPYIAAGVSFSNSDSWNQSARLINAPSGTSDFTTSAPIAPVVGRVAAGLQLYSARGIDFRLGYDAEFSRTAVAQSGWLVGSVRF
jgi:hypothetical protein